MSAAKSQQKGENMIDWKRKLTSRKFWTAIASFVTLLVTAFGAAEEVATQVTALIMAGAAVVAYIIGEGLADAANAGSTAEDAQQVEKPPEEIG